MENYITVKIMIMVCPHTWITFELLKWDVLFPYTLRHAYVCVSLCTSACIFTLPFAEIHHPPGRRHVYIYPLLCAAL